jgi:glycosyltransferase involved in cell wall biosynthesis
MKVLHVAESIRGGIATQLISLWTHQCAQYGVKNVRLVIPRAHVDDLSGVADASIRALPDVPRGIRGARRHYREIADVLRAETPDIVHAHSAIAGLVVRVLKVFGACPAPIIYCPHGWAFDRAGTKVERLFYRMVEAMLAPFTAAILCISKHEYRHARQSGIARKRLRLVYNGLPSSPGSARGDASPREWNPLCLVFVGRLDRQKGFDILIAALKQVTRPVHLTVIGDRVLDGYGETSAQDVPHPVFHKGWLNPTSVADAIGNAELVAVPSRWEGFGLVAAEALRDGTPVIATRRGGLPEVVAHGVTGWLVDQPDPTALAQAIQSVDRTTLAAWGENARNRFIRHFHAETMGRRTMAIYDEVKVTRANPIGR